MALDWQTMYNNTKFKTMALALILPLHAKSTNTDSGTSNICTGNQKAYILKTTIQQPLNRNVLLLSELTKDNLYNF